MYYKLCARSDFKVLERTAECTHVLKASHILISVVFTGVAPVPWVPRPVIWRILRRLLSPATGTILRVRHSFSSLAARTRSFFKGLWSFKDLAPSLEALRTSLKSIRPSFKGSVHDLVYGTPAPQVSFYDEPNPSYGPAPTPSYEGPGFKRSVKQHFLCQVTMRLKSFPLIQFEEESESLSELVLKNFEEGETSNESQFSFDALATALKTAHKQLQ